MKMIVTFLMTVLFFGCQQKKENKESSVDLFEKDTTAVIIETDEYNPETLVVKIPPIDYDTTEWTELIRLDSTLILDLRYATDSNFVGAKMYECGRCFLRPEVALAVVKVHRSLRSEGLGLKMYDCYRPRPIQWKLWEKVPDPRYVSDPRKGSMHNRGKAVDLTIVDAEGRELDMGTDYDFFGKEAYPAYQNLSEKVLANRKLLHTKMIAHGFKPIRTEWWHFSYPAKQGELSDMLWKCY